MLGLVRHSRGLFRASQTRFAFSSASASRSPDVADTPAQIKRRFRERLGQERENALLGGGERRIAAQHAKGKLTASPILHPVAAISVGIVEGTPLLDLEYTEDSACDTDMNVVMTGAGHFVEVQGTAEGVAFTRQEMDQLLALADKGVRELITAQAAALARPLDQA